MHNNRETETERESEREIPHGDIPIPRTHLSSLHFAVTLLDITLAGSADDLLTARLDLRSSTELGEDLSDEMVLILGQLRLVLTPFGQFFFALHIGHLAKNQSMSEIVGEHQIACKTIRKCRIEIEDFEQFITFDGMQITIGQSAHIGRALANGRVLPELIAEDVALACKDSVLSVEWFGSIRSRRASANIDVLLSNYS